MVLDKKKIKHILGYFFFFDLEKTIFGIIPGVAPESTALPIGSMGN